MIDWRLPARSIIAYPARLAMTNSGCRLLVRPELTGRSTKPSPLGHNPAPSTRGVERVGDFRYSKSVVQQGTNPVLVGGRLAAGCT